MAIPNRDILQLLKQANANPVAEHSLDALARRAGWSKFHLQREFQRLTRETPRQYIERVRLERAAAALNAGRKPVLQIALDAGFRSHEVFVRAFRKRFLCSPSQYRKRSLAGRREVLPQSYEAVVHSLSPCIRLFRITSTTSNESKTMKEPEILRVTLNPQPILFIQRTVPQAQLHDCFSECFGKLFGHGMQQGLPITGNPMARYVSIGPGLMTVDFILPLAAPAAAAEGIQAGELDGGPALKALHFGPYEDLKETYVALQNWMAQEGIKPRGPHWEHYVTDPGEEPDTSKWQTDIYWPIE